MSTPRLPPGARISFDIEPIGGGHELARELLGAKVDDAQGRGRWRITERLRVGKSGSQDLGEPMICASWAEVWSTLEILAQDRLAQLGRDAVGPK